MYLVFIYNRRQFFLTKSAIYLDVLFWKFLCKSLDLNSDNNFCLWPKGTTKTWWIVNSSVHSQKENSTDVWIVMNTDDHNRLSVVSDYHQCTYVTLVHKTSHKSHGIFVASQQYIVWVKIIDFSFLPKIFRILSKYHVPWRYFVNFLP